jgi:hypothetical protein
VELYNVTNLKPFGSYCQDTETLLPTQLVQLSLYSLLSDHNPKM